MFRRHVLLMGYVDGFHIWDVSDVNEIREITSVRQGIGQVTDLALIPDPTHSDSDPDLFAEVRPLVAIV